MKLKVGMKVIPKKSTASWKEITITDAGRPNVIYSCVYKSMATRSHLCNHNGFLKWAAQETKVVYFNSLITFRRSVAT